MPERDRRQHGVRAPGKRGEHREAFRLVGRLAEDPTVEHDSRVGGQNGHFRPALEPFDDRLRLAGGEALYVIGGLSPGCGVSSMSAPTMRCRTPIWWRSWLRRKDAEARTMAS